MKEQRYPLYAVDVQGSTYVVIGWVESDRTRSVHPVLAPRSAHLQTEMAEPGTRLRFTYDRDEVDEWGAAAKSAATQQIPAYR